MPTPILSIQSFVSFGHVGNSAAVFLLQRLGFDVWPVHTACLSNHVGYPTNGGFVPTAAQLTSQLEGLRKLEGFTNLGTIITGYLGARDVADAVYEQAVAICAEQPQARLVCDPVMGDHGELYVPLELVEFYQDHLCPMADLLVPNAFELGLLAGFTIETMSDAKQAARLVAADYETTVVATGVHLTPERQHVVASDGQEVLVIEAPHIPGRFAGAGDAFTALLVGWLQKGYPLDVSIVRATSAMTTIIEYTSAVGGELRLILAQHDLNEVRSDVVRK